MTPDTSTSGDYDPGGLRQHPALAQVIEELRAKHHDAIAGVIVYGSCLRSGDPFDGLLDLYLLCEDYRDAYRRPALALANRLLPPNVFYAETRSDGGTLRCKVTLISLRDFGRGCGRAWFESYLWGRFAQPVLLAWSRDESSRMAIEDALANASHTLLERSLPALPASGRVVDLWEGALALSYNTELRTERSGRAGELVRAAEAFYQHTAQALSGSLSFPFDVYDGRYKSEVPLSRRRLSRPAWFARRLQGKLLSVLRLIKALYTFEGGLDYIAWKLERHSGQTVVIPDSVRRRPLLHLWGFFWGLYRRGVFK